MITFTSFVKFLINIFSDTASSPFSPFTPINSLSHFQSFSIPFPPTLGNHWCAFWLYRFVFILMSYKWNFTVCTVLYLVSFSQYYIVDSKSYFNVYQYYSIYIYLYIIICLSIHMLIDIWVVSSLKLLWIKLLWTFVCNCWVNT